jgi:hypothetical protein
MVEIQLERFVRIWLIKSDADAKGTKHYLGTMEGSEGEWVRDDLWDVKHVRLVLVRDRECFELRNVDSSQEVLRVSVDTTKLELGKSWEDGACGRGCKSNLSGLFGFEINFEAPELGQGGEDCDHCLRWNITKIGYILKVKLGKVIAGQKKLRQGRKWNATHIEWS